MQKSLVNNILNDPERLPVSVSFGHYETPCYFAGRMRRLCT
jgi:hypothetical protein